MTLDDVLTRLLQPVARLAMGRGLGLRALSDPLKRAFLIEARRAAGPGATDSRLALATGLQRRDVARLRAAVPVSGPVPAPARLLRAWPGEARLSRAAFDALSRDISQDVHPRSLLDLLAASGAVAEEADGIRLLRREHLPPRGSEAQLDWLAANLHDHGMAAVGNVLEAGGGFDRAAAFTGLTAAEADRLAAAFEARQMEVLRAVAREAEAAAGGGPVRIRFGGYGYREDEA